MLKDTLVSPFSIFALLFLLASTTIFSVEAHSHPHGRLILKHQRKLLTQTEHGEISAASVTDGAKGPYHLQFITLEPNSVFLPVLLHADMVFFVHTGSGTLSWSTDDDIKNVNIRKGDVYRLPQGSVFYVQSSLEPERERLRIFAIFTNTEDDIYEPSVGAYSSITDMVLGFDSRLLQAAFKVPEDVIQEVMTASKAPAIVHAVRKEEKMFGELQGKVLKAFLRSNRGGFFGSVNGSNKKKMEAYNVLEANPDFENCNGRSVTVDQKDLPFLKHPNIGIFMVNLTKGSMMAPHWNPRAFEIAIVLQGQGMVRVLCSSHAKKSECRDMRYRVEEDDVFAVPRFHPMAQMSFNNDSFVFMGFSTSSKKNNPQFLAGKRSALRSLDRDILALSFNVSNAAIDHLLQPQKESVILDCTSCAEEEERLMEEEIEREEEKEARKKKEEEETRRRKEEEEQRQEKERKAREQEEAQRRREEEEEEKARRREEEEEQRQEEEERKAREEEEAKRRREEEEEKEEKQRQEEEQRKAREEEKVRRRRREEEEEEEEETRRREEEQRQEVEEQRKAREKEETQRRKEEEKGRKERIEEKEEEIRRRKEQKEIKKKEEKEKERREETARKEQEEARRQEEERQRRAKEEEERRWHEEEEEDLD